LDGAGRGYDAPRAHRSPGCGPGQHGEEHPSAPASVALSGAVGACWS